MSLASVSQTLYIPLVGRALASKLFPEMEFSDPSAEGLVEHLDISTQEFEKYKADVFGSARRFQLFLKKAENFFQQHPHGQGVNLGCGLADYFQFIDNGENTWLDVDLEEVIKLRSRVMPPLSDNNTYLASSILSSAWLKKLDPRKPTFILLEGVSMYLNHEEMKSLMKLISTYFTGPCFISFDHYCWLMIGRQRQHRLVRKTGAQFFWGARSIREILALNPALTLLEEDEVMENYGPGWRFVGRAFRKITQTPFYGITHLKVRT